MFWTGPIRGDSDTFSATASATARVILGGRPHQRGTKGVNQFWTLIWLSQAKNVCKSIGNWIAKLGKTWWGYYEIFCILANYYFLVPIFQPIINFLTFINPIWLTIPRGLWPKQKFSDIFIWRSPNLEKFTCEIVARRWIAIWGLRSAWITKLKKTDPHLKKWGLFSSTFLSKHS